MDMSLNQYMLNKYGPFMDTEDLAHVFRIKQNSIYQQIWRGNLNLPHIKRGKKYLFPTTEVAKYFVENTQEAV